MSSLTSKLRTCFKVDWTLVSKIGTLLVGGCETAFYAYQIFLFCESGPEFTLWFDDNRNKIGGAHVYPSIFLPLTYLVTAVLLIFGVFKGSAFYVQLWMVSRILLLITCLLMAVLFWAFYQTLQTRVPMPKFRLILTVILNFGFLLIIFNFYSRVNGGDFEEPTGIGTPTPQYHRCECGRGEVEVSIEPGPGPGPGPRPGPSMGQGRAKRNFHNEGIAPLWLFV